VNLTPVTGKRQAIGGFIFALPQVQACRIASPGLPIQSRWDKIQPNFAAISPRGAHRGSVIARTYKLMPYTHQFEGLTYAHGICQHRAEHA
jgi:hypothetical protein